MKIGTFIEEIGLTLAKVPLQHIPTAVFISFKSVNSRLEPLHDKNMDELDDQTVNELKALMETATHFVHSNDLVDACKAIDDLYHYELVVNTPNVDSLHNVEPA